MRTFSQVTKLQKDTGVARPFPFVEMDCFVPSWAKCSGEMQWDVDDPTSALKKAPDMIKWMAAFDAFAIAMDVLKLMPYSVSMAHKRNCLWVAGRAASGEKKRRHHLCMYYDEVCRREWGVMAMRQDPDFSLDTTPLLHNADFLLHAQDAYDKENVPTTRAAPQNSAPASSKGGKARAAEKARAATKAPSTSGTSSPGAAAPSGRKGCSFATLFLRAYLLLCLVRKVLTVSRERLGGCACVVLQ